MRKIFIIIAIIFILQFLLNNNLSSEKTIDKNIKITKITVEKRKRKLHIYSNNNLIKSYSISLGKNPVGAKRFEGDNKTPEGNYFINSKNPKSDFYKSLGISYPNQKDINFAKSKGKSAGGDINIHGLMNGMGLSRKIHLFYDWTDGCIAVTNQEMDELYDIIAIGTPVEIKP